MGYGFISFMTPVMLQLVRTKIINERKAEYQYKIWNEIIWLTLILVSITLVNLIYSNLIGILNINLRGFFIFLLMVLSIGVFPVMASVWMKYTHFKKLNQKEAALIEKEISSNITSVIDSGNRAESFVAENEKDILNTFSTNLLYIESVDNYSQFVIFENSKISKLLLRGSLKHFENQIKSSQIIRCHRSFIVNLGIAKNIEGNAQGYLLSIENSDQKIPVSRSYGPTIKAFFQK